MTSSPGEDTETALNRLIATGYRFVHPRDATGDLLAIVGVRAHDHVVDVVRIEAEDDVTATRMPGDEPDIFDPRCSLWHERGSVGTIVERLLALPDDAYADAVTGTPTGCWIPATPGRTKFLAAS